MESTELAFVSTQDLIAELMRRQTFLGVVIHSENEAKEVGWKEEQRFKVHFNHHLDVKSASRLLEAVSEYMTLYPC